MGLRSQRPKPSTDRIKERKAEHVEICLEKDVEAQSISTGFEEVHLIHKALPGISRDDIDLSTAVFGHEFGAPLIVEGMTGGTEKALRINAAIARAVEELGLGMGVGSQRVAIENPHLKHTFAVARKEAPTAFLVANLGYSQFVKGYGLEEARKAVEMVGADALAIHLNPLQEAVQPEGETDCRRILEKIGEIAQGLDVPVIVKETGAGIAAEVARMLEAVGVAGIDVAGAGGVSWAAVEYYRAERWENELAQVLGKTLWDWGIPTAISLVEVVQSVKVPTIASGGIRSGEDVAKAIALGASLAGLALPVLGPALKGSEEVKRTLLFMKEQLRNVMFLVGADSLDKLATSQVVLTGRVAEWLRARGFRPELYARRRI